MKHRTITHTARSLSKMAASNTDPNDAAALLELNIAGLNINLQNMFVDDLEDSYISTVTGDTPYASAITFEDLKLSPAVIQGLYVEMKFRRPSKIQAIALPMILTPPFKDLIAQAHNGTGKTTCFGLGMLGRVDPNLRAPQALCICPTRELALQSLEVIEKMGKYTGINVECAVPSMSDKSNCSSVPLHSRTPVSAHIVIGTPGTIKKFMSYKKLGVSHVKVLVFDEADHMLAEIMVDCFDVHLMEPKRVGIFLQDGFQDDSLRIMKEIERFSSHCQVLLFSATYNEMVTKFMTRVVKDSNKLLVRKEELNLEAVKQYKVYCPDELTKINVIKTKILELGENLGQSIIFVRTKASARMLHQHLVEDGYKVTTIHGAVLAEHRDKIVKEFKDSLTHVLITTDLLARGFDSKQVNLVVNYDLPVKFDVHRTRGPPEPDYELYLHRCGRAGRFGGKGAVFNLLCLDWDQHIMENIEQYYNIRIPEVKICEEAFEYALRAARLF